MRLSVLRHCGAVLFSALSLAAFAAPADTTVRIGVLAYRGPDETGTSWSDLPARLARAIPDHRFEVEELSGPKLAEAVERNELEFVLTNSTQYVSLAADFGIRRIATVMLPETLSQQQAIGSAILTLAARKDISQIADLRGKSIAAVASDAFGGYLAGAREMLAAGIDLEAGDARMVFVGSPMRRVTEALLEGEADAAIVRTCLLEQLSSKGILQAEKFKVLAPKQIAGFGCLASTPLYPDWPMAVTQRVDPQLARQVATALLSMPPSPNGLVWDVPADYQPVNDLFRDLMIGPYVDLRSTTFRGITKTYRSHFLFLLIMIAVLLVYVGWLVRRHMLELRAAKGQARELQKEAEHMARLSILGEMSGTLAH